MENPVKLQFFDIPVFIQKVKEAHREYPTYSPANCVMEALRYRGDDNWINMFYTLVNCNEKYKLIGWGGHIRSEHYCTICDSEWVTDLQEGVEAIFKQEHV